MAFVFHCPQCSSILKTGAPLEIGRSIQCPRCAHLFTAADTRVELEGDVPFPQSAPFESLPSAEIPRTRPGEERRPARDDRDEARRRPDDRQRDTRDRPREQDRYDDRPRRRDFDDEPRRRRRYADDYDDRPRRRPAQGGGRTALIVVLVILGVIGALVGLAWTLDDSDDEVARAPFAPGVDTEMLAMAPADTAVIVGINVDQLRDHPKFARTVGQLIMSSMPDRNRAEREFQETGLSEHDISGVMITASEPGGSGNVIAIRFNRDIDRDRVVKGLHARSQSNRLKKYYTSGARNGSGFFFAGKRMIVFAQNHSTLIDLLHHNRNTERIGGDLRAVAARGTGVYWAALRKNGGEAALNAMAGGIVGNDLFEDADDKAEGMLISMMPQNNQLECDIGFKVRTNNEAQNIAQQMQGKIPQRRQALKDGGLDPDERAIEQAVVQSARFRADGEFAFVKFRVEIDLFARMVQNMRANRINVGP